MPTTIAETDTFTPTLTAPQASEPASAPGLIAEFLQGIANRTFWLKNRRTEDAAAAAVTAATSAYLSAVGQHWALYSMNSGIVLNAGGKVSLTLVSGGTGYALAGASDQIICPADGAYLITLNAWVLNSDLSVSQGGVRVVAQASSPMQRGDITTRVSAGQFSTINGAVTANVSGSRAVTLFAISGGVGIEVRPDQGPCMVGISRIY